MIVALAVVLWEWLGTDRRTRRARARGADRLPTYPDFTGTPFRLK